YTFDVDWRDPLNQVARETPLKVMRCPSTPNPNRVATGTFNNVAWKAAVGDYAPDNAINSALVGLNIITTRADYTGALQVNHLLRVAEVVDGLSTTIFITEDAGRPTVYRSGKKKVNGNVSGAGWADRDAEFITHGATADGATQPGPCHTNCTNENEIYAFHPG